MRKTRLPRRGIDPRNYAPASETGNPHRPAALRGPRQLGKTLKMNSTRAEPVAGDAKSIHRVIKRGWIAFVDSRIAEFGAPGRAVRREGRRMA
jgi:hypothetical protein